MLYFSYCLGGTRVGAVGKNAPNYLPGVCGDSMTVDILQHKFVPSHEILEAKELKSVLEQLGAVKEQLPKMSVNDPVAKRIKAAAGSVVKIVRKSPTAGEAVYYRVIV